MLAIEQAARQRGAQDAMFHVERERGWSTFYQELSPAKRRMVGLDRLYSEGRTDGAQSVMKERLSCHI